MSWRKAYRRQFNLPDRSTGALYPGPRFPVLPEYLTQRGLSHDGTDDDYREGYERKKGW